MTGSIGTTDTAAIVRCLGFVGSRLVKVSRRADRIPSKALARQARALEMLVAACVADAADPSAPVPEIPRMTRHTAPLPESSPSPERPPPPPPGPIVRGTWDPPSR